MADVFCKGHKAGGPSLTAVYRDGVSVEGTVPFLRKPARDCCMSYATTPPSAGGCLTPAMTWQENALPGVRPGQFHPWVRLDLNAGVTRNDLKIVAAWLRSSGYFASVKAT